MGPPALSEGAIADLAIQARRLYISIGAVRDKVCQVALNLNAAGHGAALGAAQRVIEHVVVQDLEICRATGQLVVASASENLNPEGCTGDKPPLQIYNMDLQRGATDADGVGLAPGCILVEIPRDVAASPLIGETALAPDSYLPTGVVAASQEQAQAGQQMAEVQRDCSEAEFAHSFAVAPSVRDSGIGRALDSCFVTVIAAESEELKRQCLPEVAVQVDCHAMDSARSAAEILLAQGSVAEQQQDTCRAAAATAARKDMQNVWTHAEAHSSTEVLRQQEPEEADSALGAMASGPPIWQRERPQQNRHSVSQQRARPSSASITSSSDAGDGHLWHPRHTDTAAGGVHAWPNLARDGKEQAELAIGKRAANVSSSIAARADAKAFAAAGGMAVVATRGAGRTSGPLSFARALAASD